VTDSEEEEKPPKKKAAAKKKAPAAKPAAKSAASPAKRSKKAEPVEPAVGESDDGDAPADLPVEEAKPVVEVTKKRGRPGKAKK